MAATGLALFDTPIGRCGIAWNASGIAAVQLPEAREAATRARLQRRVPDAVEAPPPRSVQRAIERIQALLRGEASDLSEIALDMSGIPEFHRRVYQAARAIPPGETRSYGEIAARIGDRGQARAVGRALGANPFAIVVPCHRVLAAGGRAGGFSAGGGVTTKLRLLAIESAQRSLLDAPTRPALDGRRAVAHLRRADPVLARVIEAVGPLRLERKNTPSLFGALAEAIVYQQLNGRAAATIHARVCALFPRPHEGPTPAQILRASDAKLRGAGLSAAKLLAIRDLARKAQDAAIPTLAEAHELDDAVLIERLTAVRGIGTWTVQMLLMFRLGRPDVLPVDDYGIRKGFQIAYRKRALPAPKDVAKHGARWAPHRSAASWYLWRATELDAI